MIRVREMYPNEQPIVDELVYSAYAEHGYFPKADATGDSRKVHGFKKYTNEVRTLVAIKESRIVGTLSYGYGIETLEENVFGSQENKHRIFRELSRSEGGTNAWGTSTRGSIHELRQAIMMLSMCTAGKLLVCTRFASAKEYWGRDGLQHGMYLIREIVKISLLDGADVSAFIVNPRHVRFYKGMCGAEEIASIPNAPGLEEGKAPGVLMWLFVDEFAKRIETAWPDLDESLRKKAKQLSSMLHPQSEREAVTI